MPHLVALDLPAGPGLVDAVARCWDAGDAVANVDRHAPDEARRRWLDAVWALTLWPPAASMTSIPWS